MHSLIIALNPSIDAEWHVDDVVWEEKNNVHSERRWAGGKGVNVARWIKHLGGHPLLLLPLGGNIGTEIAVYLRKEKISATSVRLGEPTRVNVIVTTAARRQMRFNPSGPILSHAEWRDVVTTADRALARANLLVLSGSLPRGVPVTAYAQLIRRAGRTGVKTLLDCDGEALAKAVPARPFLVKPNEHELAAWAGQSLRSEHAVLAAATKMSAITHGWVLVSRGGERSWLVNASARAQFSADPKRVTPKNTVGAGDALLAAVAMQIARGASAQSWLDTGVAIGTLATEYSAGELPPESALRMESRA
jgi:1-phosphofructokinase family hexose kinase